MTNGGKEAIIILSHGSKNQEAVMQFSELVKNIQSRKSTVKVQGAFLQLADPLIFNVVEGLVKEGYEKIGLVPFFLMHGNHVVRDIPDLVEGLKKEFPQVKFTVGAILYPDTRLEGIIADRIEEVCS